MVKRKSAAQRRVAGKRASARVKSKMSKAASKPAAKKKIAARKAAPAAKPRAKAVRKAAGKQAKRTVKKIAAAKKAVAKKGAARAAAPKVAKARPAAIKRAAPKRTAVARPAVTRAVPKAPAAAATKRAPPKQAVVAVAAKPAVTPAGPVARKTLTPAAGVAALKPPKAVVVRSAGPDENLLADLVGMARRAGADAADAIYVHGESLFVSQRLGQREKLERSESNDLGLRVFIGKCQASVSTTDFDRAALKALVERCVAMARAVPEDPVCGLAPEELLAQSMPDLDLDDGEDPVVEQFIEWIGKAEAAALDVKGVTNSEGAEAGWGRSRMRMVASNGFAGSYARGGYSLSCSVLAGEGTHMQRDYEWSSAVHGSDLMDAEQVGRRAGENVVRKLNPRKLKSGPTTIIFDRRVSGSLLGHLAGAINGRAIARGTSFLKDRLDQQIFGEGVTVTDDPHRRRGLGSRPFDGEGLATRHMSVVDRGVLTTWLLDLAAARQLGLLPTGHASRGVSGPPGPTPSNFHMEPGRVSHDELIGDVAHGLYVTELIGFGVNGVTGDYSRGAGGYLIQNGKIGDAVNGVTIAGNLKDMFARLVPANDLEFKSSTNAPTVRIDDMTLAGE